MDFIRECLKSWLSFSRVAILKSNFKPWKKSKSSFLLLWNLTSLVFYFSLVPEPGMALNDEGHTLLHFVHNAMFNQSSLSDWNAYHSTPCRWTGIQCSPQQHVLSINLSGKNLRGHIRLDTRKLKWLQALNLHSNYLSGAIPPELGQLGNLTDLDLSNNQLSGEIPATLNHLTRLSNLNLSKNRLLGSVPERGVLATFTSVSFQDNPDLCGYLTTRECDTTRFLAVTTKSSIAPTPLVGLSPKINGSNTHTSKTTLSVGVSVAVVVFICLSAIALSKIFLGGLLYWRWTKVHSVCEIKLCGKTSFTLQSRITLSKRVSLMTEVVEFQMLMYSRKASVSGMVKLVVEGGKMVMLQLSGKATPSSTEVMKKIEKLTTSDIIGIGGYGTVYRLVLDYQFAFAVKKLTRGSLDRERGFERELETLAGLKHKNLITLRGYYSAPHINILVYDLMVNGNLDNALHEYKETGFEPLDWEMRHRIAVGAARGLAYLHHDCIPKIIHRDIKTSNILLNDEFEARVSDFGLAKLMSAQQTHVSTQVAGTFGYLAPEYVETGLATEKGDIYSFGVVLLELLTGKRPCDDIFQENGLSLAKWVQIMVEDNQIEQVLDESFAGACPDKEASNFVFIALHCVNFLPSHRPTMAQVVKMLESVHSAGVSVSNNSSMASSSYTSG